MPSTNYAGIDYSLGRSNFDKVTGIHFGVIGMNSIMLDASQDFENDYGTPHCPQCGNNAVEYNEEKHGAYIAGSFSTIADYACEVCEVYFPSEDVFAEEPIGWSYQQDGYKLCDCLNNDIFVLASPYYTFAQYCSPCVPGAGNLNTPCDNGPKTYCLSHDWFEDGKAPYRVYRVSDDTEVLPETK